MPARKARLQDAKNIYDIIQSFTGDGTLLPRRMPEICRNIRDFYVVESSEGTFLGCGALHLYGPHLAEIRSIAVHPHAQRTGAGSALIEALLAEAESCDVACVCLFTRAPNFFRRLGFSPVEHSLLPDKIYKDCQHCPRLHACDEVAMARGKLPVRPVRVRDREHELVQLV